MHLGQVGGLLEENDGEYLSLGICQLSFVIAMANDKSPILNDKFFRCIGGPTSGTLWVARRNAFFCAVRLMFNSTLFFYDSVSLDPRP
jgi:hypothetical protein